ncbi:MAG: glycoside hydrolase family 5 protein [Ruminiclostridium sp.]
MKTFKKAVSLILSAVIIAVTLTACTPSGPHPSKNGITTVDNGVMRKDMTSDQYVVEMGIGENLGNTMEAYWSSESNKTSGASQIGSDTPSDYEKCWGAGITTQEAIDGMKAAGFDTVRIPVYWGNMMADDGTFTINDDYFNRVEEIINYCHNDGLYVVINVHHYDEFLVKHLSEDEAVEAAKIVWTQIANRFKEYSDYLIFEGYNENLGTVRDGDNYTDDEKFAYVNRMNQTFVDAVRATGGNNASRMLIISGYWTNIDLTTSEKFVVPTDTVSDRIMVSVHYVDNAMYWTNQIGSQSWYDYAIAQCELLKKAFTDKGIKVFVGECTSIYGKERFSSNAEVTDEPVEAFRIMMNMITDYGFIPVLWDVDRNFYLRSAGKIRSEEEAAVVAETAKKINPDREEFVKESE